LFWKRKKSDSQVFSFHSEDQRTSFRVTPLRDSPVEIRFGGKPVRLKNIGAVGVAFPNDGFQVGSTQVIDLNLPGESQALSAEIEIVDIDTDEVCHCTFVSLNQEAVNAIHRYMLRVQIAEIRNAKKCIGRVEDDSEDLVRRFVNPVTNSLTQD
jgi:hypothetical protein